MRAQPPGSWAKEYPPMRTILAGLHRAASFSVRVVSMGQVGTSDTMTFMGRNVGTFLALSRGTE